MKKIVTVLAVFLSIGSTSLMAQQGEGRSFDPAKMKERELQRLKESDLKLTDVQADSVVAINIETMKEMRGIRELAQEERAAKLKEVDALRLKRWSEALKDKELANKVAAYYEKQRAERQAMRERPQQ